ncbi:MAG: hypothetical protein IKO61_02690 [Lachnospiraceae bacterium]|nr:hypothetical protein [Lachnospiraceae bacterium]
MGIIRNSATEPYDRMSKEAEDYRKEAMQSARSGAAQAFQAFDSHCLKTNAILFLIGLVITIGLFSTGHWFLAILVGAGTIGLIYKLTEKQGMERNEIERANSGLNNYLDNYR